jgi:hypothetical protein
MISWKCTVSCCIAGLMFGMVAGCSKVPARTPVQEVPVKGVVKLDGNPLAAAEVMFITQSQGVFTAATKEDGSFQLSSSFGGEPVCKGPCKVTIGKWIMPEGAKLEPNMSPQLQGAKQLLPPRYSDPDATTLAQDVPEAGGDFKFELTSK